MSENKIKEKPKKIIKEIDKGMVGVQKFKNNIITTKEKIKEITIDDDNNSGEEYAERKIQNNISYVTRKGLEKANELGKKSINETQENFIKEKQKIETLKNKIKEKKLIDLENIIENNSKDIKQGTKQIIKTEKNATALTKKTIKTTEQVAKNTEKIAKESNKLSQKIVRATQKTVQATVKGVKATIKVTVKTVKTTIESIKSIISLIMAGGWIVIIIILIIVLIGGFIAIIVNGNGNDDYDMSQIPNNEIVLVAKSQIGNEGGDKFWKWYGFDERVEWCACFVSWCANECDYIDKGIFPKFSFCNDGINWFKEKEEWHDRGDNYYPIVGDIIFFDWFDKNVSQDSISDHVGIVTKTDIINRTIYTIEGNTSNKCAERIYSFDDKQIMGYGSPKYE